MAAEHSTGTPPAMQDLVDLVDVSLRANELELLLVAMRTFVLKLVAMSTPNDEDYDERCAINVALERMALAGVGMSGAIARAVGSREVGELAAELRDLAPAAKEQRQ